MTGGGTGAYRDRVQWAGQLTSQAPAHARLVGGAQCLTAAVALAFVLTTLGWRSGFDPLLDGWLQGSGYVLCAVLAALRPALSRRGRLLWSLVAVALACRALAFGTFLGYVRRQDPVPYPSIADVGWLACTLLLCAAMVVFARSRFERLTWPLVLDGVVGACLVGAAAWAVLPGAIDSLTSSATPESAIVANALYPILDVALVLTVLGVLVGYRWQAPPGMWTFAAGVVALAVQDSVYLALLAEGAFRPATPLSGLGMLATLTIAFAPWAPRGSGRARPQHLPGLVVPAVLSGLCVVLLVLAAVYDLPLPAVALAAFGLLATIARTLISFHGLRQLSVVRREARTDDLTGLANRRAFYEALDRALRNRAPGRSMAVLVLDLDGFKDVNDSLGHHRGDELLSLVAPRLQLVMRDQDLVARVGGDEFGVLLENADAEAAGEVASRLRSAARGPYALAGRTLVVGMSAGIAVWPQDGSDGSELLQRADTAMYAAKDERSGQSYFRPDYHRASQARLESVAEMRDAIEQGQFVLHYQPKVQLQDGSWEGVEALVRWQHPTQGLLPPAAFLQQAESGDLMRMLTSSVLEQAVDQWVAWHHSGIDLSIAVNLSVSDLLNREFPDQVAAVLADRAAPGQALVLELTEDLLLADPGRGHWVLRELVGHGVRVQVDDYGTGFSTLGYLRDLPDLDGLKIDRSFVGAIATDRRSAAIVESTVSLAGALGLELIAEGIEDGGARDRLLELGVQLGQGWLFGRPAPADRLFDLAGAPRP